MFLIVILSWVVEERIIQEAIAGTDIINAEDVGTRPEKSHCQYLTKMLVVGNTLLTKKFPRWEGQCGLPPQYLVNALQSDIALSVKRPVIHSVMGLLHSTRTAFHGIVLCVLVLLVGYSTLVLQQYGEEEHISCEFC